MKTLPSPSTASPVKHAPPASRAKWSSACPGVASASKGPKRTPLPSVTSASPRPAASGAGRSSSSLRTASAWSGWSWVSATPPRPPRASIAASTRPRCSSISGPGSTTHAGARPRTQVLVPDRVSAPWFGARTSTMSWPASASAPDSSAAGAPSAGAASAGAIAPSDACRLLMRATLADSALLLKVGHDVLDDRIVLHAVDAEVLAVAGLLEPAVRHLGDERDVVVDPHAAEAQRPGDAQSAADVTRPHRGREPVARGVGPCDRLLLVAEALHRDDRAEDLPLDQLVLLLETGDDGRLEVEAGPLGPPAPGHDLRVRRPALEEAPDPFELARRVDGAERGLGRQRVADHEALGLLGQTEDDVVVDPRAGQHAGGRRAVLPGVVVAGARDRLQRALEADVVEHEHRRLAA